MVFISSLQEMKGDNKLVNLVEDWEIIEEYAGEKLGFYQLLDYDGKKEIRVLTGRIGYKKEFELDGGGLLNRILDFCKKHCFIRVYENVQDEQFFR
jgi:hypothetical protein